MDAPIPIIIGILIDMIFYKRKGRLVKNVFFCWKEEDEVKGMKFILYFVYIPFSECTLHGHLEQGFRPFSASLPVC